MIDKGERAFLDKTGEEMPYSRQELVENMLKTFCRWRRKGKPLLIPQICQEFDLTRRDLTYYIRKMTQCGYLQMPGGSEELKLTEFGITLGEENCYRHDSLTQFLQLIGVEQDEAEQDACRMEHVVGAATIEKICDFMNYGTTYERVIKNPDLRSRYKTGTYEFPMGLYCVGLRYPRVLSDEYFWYKEKLLLEVGEESCQFRLQMKEPNKGFSTWYQDADIGWREAKQDETGAWLPAEAFQFTMSPHNYITEGTALIAFMKRAGPPTEKDCRELNVHIWQGRESHPVTGVIEDSGGEASYATGQGMVESAVNKTGIIEVLQNGTYYLTIRLSLMDYTSGHSFWVQNIGDSNWSSPALGVTATGSDSNGSTADVCIQVPSENCVVRGAMYVEPMGRDVVFYLYPTNYVSGNSTSMVSTMIVEDTPVQSNDVTAEQNVQTEAPQTEAPLETEAALSAEAETKDGTALAEAAMEEARGLRMSMDLEMAKEETSASADGLKIVAASPEIAEICEKLEIDLVGVCAQDAEQVPERYADAVITATEDEERLEALAALEPDWILDAVSKKSERQDTYEELDADWAFLNLDSIAGMYRSISELGEIFGKEAEEQALVEELGAFYESYSFEEIHTEAAVLVATPDGCMAAADTSYLGDLAAIAGGSSVYTETESAYVALDLEELASMEGIMILAPLRE